MAPSMAFSEKTTRNIQHHMQAQITVPFEELQAQWKKANAPVYIRKTSRKDWVNIIKCPKATDEEVEIFLFGTVLSRPNKKRKKK